MEQARWCSASRNHVVFVPLHPPVAAGVVQVCQSLFLFFFFFSDVVCFFSFLSHVLGFGEWEVLLANAAVSLFVYFGSRMFATVSKDKRN